MAVRPPLLAAAVSCGALLGAAAAGPPAAGAAAGLSVTPAGGPPGTPISVTGRGFARSQPVRLRAGGRVRTVRAGAGGRFAARLVMPARSTALVAADRARAVRALLLARRAAAGEAEVADAHGVRIRHPLLAPAGGRLALAGRGLRSTARIQAPGAPRAVLAPRGGRLAGSVALPARTGPVAVVVRSGRTRLVLRVTLTPRPAPAPAASLDTPFAAPAVVAAVGDIACDPTESNFNGGMGTARACRHRNTAHVVKELTPDHILTLGDHQYRQGRADQFAASYELWWGELKPITRPAPGNHDYGTRDAVDYFDYFNGPGVEVGAAGRRGEGWYSFEAGPWHVVALNSNCAKVAGGCGEASPQAAWLRADLAASDARCTLAYFHHPLFTSGKNPATPEMRPLWQLLYDEGAEVVLVGHDHNYERFAPQNPQGELDPERGIRQFIVGTGGRSLRTPGPVMAPNSETFRNESSGVLRLELGAAGYSWRFVAERAEAIDESGAEACH
jgi:hypothetical protein